jgi:hypothetical protein
LQITIASIEKCLIQTKSISLFNLVKSDKPGGRRFKKEKGNWEGRGFKYQNNEKSNKISTKILTR